MAAASRQAPGGRGLVLAIALLGATAGASASELRGIDNPQVDMPGFLHHARAAAEARRTRRLSETAFLRMRAKPGTVVLESLAALIPNPATRTLVDCNNNFRGAPGAFPSKLPAASLNLATVVALRTHGYRQVHELGPLLDADSTLLPLVSTRASH